MKKKIHLVILFGGQSVEHEVSIQSAHTIVDALNTRLYDLTLVYITRVGTWHIVDSCNVVKKQLIHNCDSNNYIIPCSSAGRCIVVKNGKEEPVDVVFPVLHGSHGEDGTIQGLFTLAEVPFVGSSILGSVVGINKSITKQLCERANLLVPQWYSYTKEEQHAISFRTLARRLSLPFFVKPVCLGSSVGVSKVHSRSEFVMAVKKAFTYDNNIICEQAIDGIEIECAVLGNEKPRISICGEIVSVSEFYSYEAKYLDAQGARLYIPARISKKIHAQIQTIAKKAYMTLGCEGMARVDFFLSTSGKIYLNEINTIPGFTTISMYPQLWEASGIPIKKLIDKLIQLALERFKKNKKIKYTT